MTEPSPPHWLLIAVLFSTVPLPQALAMRLYQAAVDLHRRDEGVTRLQGDLAQGEVRRLDRVLLIGSMSGPGFEADLDTPHGSGRVRFIVTNQGLEVADEAMGEGPVKSRPPASMLN